jgi:hypothetical protein
MLTRRMPKAGYGYSLGWSIQREQDDEGRTQATDTTRRGVFNVSQGARTSYGYILERKYSTLAR